MNDNINASLKRQLAKTFFQMIEDLDSKEDIETFFADFFDDEEFEKYIKRLAITYWVKKGRDQENIKKNLCVTNKEIDKAKDILNKKGLKLAIKKIEADEWANVWAEKIKKYSKI